MIKAVVVDKNYGSVSLDKLNFIKDKYAEKGINLRLEHYSTPQEIIDNCQDVDAILATGNPPINKQVLDNLPNLKIVQRFGIGVNSIDLNAATENGVLAMYMPGFCINELAVHATALILDLLRNIGYYDRGIRKGEWRKATGPLPKNPSNMVLGLYGFGGSAQELYKIFNSGFGTKVITCDPYFKLNDNPHFNVELVSFDTLVKESDIISIHAPLTPETKHIFNMEIFKQMKKDAMIINIARGELINQDDLIDALKQGEIQYAGLDVFDKEPLPISNELTTMEHATLTCHSAFYGQDAQQNQISLATNLVINALINQKVPAKYIANSNVKSKINNLVITK